MVTKRRISRAEQAKGLQLLHAVGDDAWRGGLPGSFMRSRYPAAMTERLHPGAGAAESRCSEVRTQEGHKSRATSHGQAESPELRDPSGSRGKKTCVATPNLVTSHEHAVRSH